MNKTLGSEVLLTSDDVRRWQAELQECEAAKAKAEARIGELCTKLQAAALLAGALFPPPAAAAAPHADNSPQESMGEASKRILGAFHRSVFHHELQAELRKIDRFREMLDKNGGAYYYTMINRLKKSGDVKKIGKKIRLIPKETPSEESPEGVTETVEG